MRGRSGFSIDADGRNGTIDAVPMAPKWIGVVCVYVVIGVLLALSNRYPGIYVILTGGIWLVGLTRMDHQSENRSVFGYEKRFAARLGAESERAVDIGGF